MTGIKIAAFIGLSSTMGIVVMPDDLNTWPATAILGLITMASLSIVFFVMKKLFEAISTLNRTADGIQELNAKLNTRPCLKE